MLKNYLKIAIRSLTKQKIYSFINIAGLSVGIASCLLIMLQVKDELSFDAFHEKADNVYKVVLERKYPDHVTNYAIVPHSYSEVMVKDFPEIKNAVRINGGGRNAAVRVQYVNEKHEEKTFEENRFILADTTFFDIFSIKLLKGDKKSALSKPQTIVLTESTAKKYFGNENPIDKVLRTDFGDITVTGVCEDVPANSHMEFDFIGSLRSQPFFFNVQNFTGFSTHLYIELSPGTSPKDLEAKFPKMVETYAAPQIEQNLKTTFAEYTAKGNGYNYSLIPLKDIHLFPTEYQGELKPGGDINDVYILISIALLIIVIACINFMNLATARSTERAKEVGIRKTMGSLRGNLIGQFLAESVVLCFVATAVAILIVTILMPSFNSLVGKPLAFHLNDPLIILTLIGLVFIVGIIAGSYPAFALSSFNPVDVMKGSMSTGKSTSWLRNSLVIFQFAISIILIIGTLVVQEQLKFMNSKDMGYNRENLVVIERVNVLNRQNQQQQLITFMDELRKLPSVKEVGGSSFTPVNQYTGTFFQLPGAADVITANTMSVDDEYPQTMEFNMIKGRSFSKEFNDSLSIIINQQMAAVLKLEDPIGHKLMNTNGNPPVQRELTIIGIVGDFHYMSMKEKITPFAIFSNEGGINAFTGAVSVRIKSENRSEALSSLENVWKKFAPQEPFRFRFLDDDLRSLYKSEADTGKIFGVFSAIAIIIACVGLFGLAAYISGLRTKEIGIRKVLGASVDSVVFLLSKDFTKLILISLVFAIPLGWYVMSEWLGAFAYRTNIDLWIYATAGLSALAIALLTVSYQSIKAAIRNPVKSLRSE
jgi:putative ABC transport system permease protein